MIVLYDDIENEYKYYVRNGDCYNYYIGSFYWIGGVIFFELNM